MDRKKKKIDSRVARAVVKVGHGRGFVIQRRTELPPLRGVPVFRDDRLVVTAAHCLPWFPPCHAMSYTEERTYQDLLGKLDARKTDVWAECLFADPIADIAVLCGPDDQQLGEEFEAYDALTEDARAIPVGKTPLGGPAWLLTLGGQWMRCAVKLNGNMLCIDKATKTEGGMSGSPILSDDGKAIGFICIGGELISSDGVHETTDSFTNPVLANHLPAWLLREVQ
jgi:hypothetical protein